MVAKEQENPQPELSPAERRLIRPFLVNEWKKGVHPADFGYLSIDKQIETEERFTQDALHWVNERLSAANRSDYSERFYYQHVKHVLELREDELEREWFSEDQRIRMESGANLVDLKPMLASLSIPSRSLMLPIKNQNPGRRNYLRPEQSQTALRAIGEPEGVSIFGNSVYLPADDFLYLINRFELLDTYREISDTGWSSRVGVVNKYHVVAPVRSWKLVSQNMNQADALRYEEKKKTPEYWPGLIVPQGTIPHAESYE